MISLGRALPQTSKRQGRHAPSALLPVRIPNPAHALAELRTASERDPLTCSIQVLSGRDRDHGHWRALLGRMARRPAMVRVRVRVEEGDAFGRDGRHLGTSSSLGLVLGITRLLLDAS